MLWNYDNVCKKKIKMKDGSIQEATFEEEAWKNAFRHTTAQAVKRLYPNTKIEAEMKKALKKICNSSTLQQTVKKHCKLWKKEMRHINRNA